MLSLLQKMQETVKDKLISPAKHEEDENKNNTELNNQASSDAYKSPTLSNAEQK
ncbi:hypothetical protein [Coxiella-like endosymbiont]|uniref:hypothetical protein n=1 Tax=Coxiella-like endosymbiont TaxID=1592897 RepID=UPI00272987B8|nr:hypothetical protein [Coxiella-like endosymbiont]